LTDTKLPTVLARAMAPLRFPINCIRLRSIARARWVLDYELVEAGL
jgi:hypothetical protein